MMPLEGDEFDDDGAEPTRIADMSGPNSPLSAGMAAAAMRSPPNAASSPKIMVSAPMPAPAPTPAPVAVEPVAAPAQRQSKGSSGLTTGIAVGLLAGILLVGGPMLYRNTWGTPAPAAPVAEAPVAEQPKPVDIATKDIVADVPAEPAAAEIPKAEAKAGGKGAGAKTEPKVPAAPKDNLTDEQRALLARMGGGGGDIANVGRAPKAESGGNAGPSLTAPQLMGVVQNNKSALQRCYESALRAAGGQQQDTIKVTVNVVVGESGTVKSVTTQGNGLGSMNDCLKSSVKRWRFPASGGESEFAFPLVFQPGA